MKMNPQSTVAGLVLRIVFVAGLSTGVSASSTSADQEACNKIAMVELNRCLAADAREDCRQQSDTSFNRCLQRVRDRYDTAKRALKRDAEVKALQQAKLGNIAANQQLMQGELGLATLPKAMQADIKEAVAASGWSEGCEPVSSIRYQALPLSGGRRLLLLALPDYLCEQSNSYMPLLLNGDDILGWGAAYPGQANRLVQDQQGGFYLSSYWAIEGSYPMLYDSNDGISWSAVKLPEQRQRDCCFETIESLQVEAGVLRLGFANGDHPGLQFWQADITSSGLGRWQHSP